MSDAGTLPIAFLFAALAATPPALAGQADSAGRSEATDDSASEWWAKVETADGVVDWTSEFGRFVNIDACG